MQTNTLFSRKAITAASAMLVACSGVVPAFGAPSVSKPHTPTFRQPAPAVTTMPPCVPGQLVLEIKNGADSDEIKQDLDAVGGKIVKTVSDDTCTVALVQVSTDDKKFIDAFKKMSKDKKNFNLVQENRTYAACSWPSGGEPNDPDLDEQPQFFTHNILDGQKGLANRGKSLPISDPSYPGRAALVIGLLDTGCESWEMNNAMDFYPNQVLPGLTTATGMATGNVDSDSGDVPPMGIGGHGSFCSEIMAAATNNSRNGAGFVPGAQIDPVDVFNGAGTTSDMELVLGLKFLQKEPGVKFVNCSINALAGPFTLNSDPVYLHAVAAFNQKTGGAVFNAAGNLGLFDGSPIYAPNGVPVNIVISAVDSNRNLAPFSNFGVPILFAGVGVADGSTNASGTFLNGDGTSFASPSCCAIAASLQYLHPKDSLFTILSQMAHNTRQVGIGHPGVNNGGFGLPSMDEVIKDANH